jgi:hypothetical protein
MILDKRPLKVPIGDTARKAVEGHAEIVAAVHAHARAYEDRQEQRRERLGAGLPPEPLAVGDGS